MTKNYLWLTAVAVVGASAMPVVAQPLVPISACWDGEDIFVAYRLTEKSTHAGTIGRGVWMDQESPRAWYGSFNIVRDKVEKLTLAHDRLWAVGNVGPKDRGPQFFSVVPVEDLQYFEGGDWGQRLLKKKFGPDANPGQLNESHRHMVYDLFWGGETEQEFYKLAAAWRKENEKGKNPFDPTFGGPPLSQYRTWVMFKERFDLIPTGEKTATFVRAQGDTITFQELHVGEPIGAKNYKGAKPLPDSKARSVKVSFDGDFWAYKVDDVFYLLTRTGKLYMVRDNAKGELEATTLWDVKDRPLIGAIQDARRKTVFAFGTDDDPKKGGRFVFEMAPVADPAFYQSEAKAGDGFREIQDSVRGIKKHLKQDHLPPVVAPAPRLKP